tara:strand:+ start:1812 stop:2690 length:879 start_codon:yes stop_codon:yes gene_type:complete
MSNKDRYMVPAETWKTAKKSEEKNSDPKETFAKDDWPLDVGFKEFEAEPFEKAIELFEARIPKLRENLRQIIKIADQKGKEIAIGQKAGVASKIDPHSNTIAKSIDDVFFVSNVEGVHQTIILQDLIAQAMRGDLPGEGLALPDFLNHEWLKNAQNLTASHLETVYRTNMSSAYNEGHMVSLRSPEVKAVAPLMMIMELDDRRARPHHTHMDGYIHTTEEIDRMHLRPPNGYNCRGQIRGVGWREAMQLGLVKEVDGQPKQVDYEALERYNGNRQVLIDNGEYPDEGFRDFL